MEPTEKLKKYNNEMFQVLTAMNHSIIAYTSGHGYIEDFVNAVDKLKELRRLIMETENITFQVAVSNWAVSAHKLNNDPDMDDDRFKNLPKN
jgi:hypothetical protein